MPPHDVSIVQPYVPEYRVPLFDELNRRLAAVGATMQVVAPQASGAQADRGDGTAGQSWRTLLPPGRTWRVGPGTLVSFGSHEAVRGSKVVILPLWGTLIDAHRALWSIRRHRPRVGLWGHIDTYVNPQNRLDLMVERAMMHRSDHVFAYTGGGARFAERQGLPADKVTVLNNTIDTGALVSAIQRLSPAEVAAFRAEHGLEPTKTFAYIGGMDHSKRIDFLADALAELHQLDPAAKVVIAGRGADENLLAPAVHRGQAVMIGYAGPEEKALIARTARAILNPGRIGLLAVDALVMGLPIITTDFKFHGPEVEYLEEATSLRRVVGGPDQYARFIARTPPGTAVMSAPRLEDMVTRFVDGVSKMLSA